MKEMILRQIECDKHNIQELINMLPNADSKGKYRSIVANIKILVKEIKYQKLLLSDKLYEKPKKLNIPLFEVNHSEIDFNDFHNMSNLSSFFGNLDD